MQARDAITKAGAELDKASQNAYNIDQARVHQGLAECWTRIAEIIANHPEAAV